MRIGVKLGADRVEVEVGGGLAEVTVNGRRYPVTVVEGPSGKVEVEIDGERVVVEGWPAGLAEPPTEIVLNGERFPLELERLGGIAAAVPAPTRPPSAVAPAPAAAVGGEGIAVVPPMPGKVVELRVHDGDRVSRGQVLLVLEAMKMRNEVVSPADGVVRDLAVSAGGTVRAHARMLRIAPA